MKNFGWFLEQNLLNIYELKFDIEFENEYENNPKKLFKRH